MFRVGVAGVGFGATVHLPVLRSLSDVEVVGVAASSVERAEVVASQFGVPHAVDSVQRLLDLGLDAIVLALPPDENELAAERAIEAEVAIFSEKPLARRAVDAERLRDKARDRVTAVDFEFVELASFRAARDVLRAGDLGGVVFADLRWLTLSRGIERGVWSWKTDAARGGGVVNLLGTMAIHVLEWLLGPVSSVVATGSARITSALTPPGRSPALESIAVLARLTDGLDVSLRLSNAARGSQVHEWTIVLERGTVVVSNRTMDPAAGFACTVSAGNGSRTIAVESSAIGDGRLAPVSIVARRFVEAVKAGTPAQPDFAAAARVQRVAEAIELAVNSHGRVRTEDVDGG